MSIHKYYNDSLLKNKCNSIFHPKFQEFQTVWTLKIQKKTKFRPKKLPMIKNYQKPTKKEKRKVKFSIFHVTLLFYFNENHTFYAKCMYYYCGPEMLFIIFRSICIVVRSTCDSLRNTKSGFSKNGGLPNNKFCLTGENFWKYAIKRKHLK